MIISLQNREKFKYTFSIVDELMKIVFTLIKTMKENFFVAIILGAIAGIGYTGLIVMVSKVHVSNFQLVYLYSFLSLLTVVIISSIGSAILLAKISQKSFYLLQKSLCNKILKLPLFKLEKIGRHKLYAILTQDVSSVINFITISPTLLINMVIVLTGIAYLGLVSIKILASVLFLTAIMISLFFYLNKNYLKPRFNKSRESIDRFFSGLQGLLEGAKELRLHKDYRESFIHDDLISSAKSYYKDNFIGMCAFSIGNGVWQLLFYLLLGMLVFVPGRMLGVNELVLLRCIMIVIFIINPLRTVIYAFPTLEKSLISANKIKQLENEINECILLPDKHVITNKYSNFHLELKDVGYKYFVEDCKKKFELGSINLFFNPSEIVFIVGHNGSGKSTLIKLITGLYEPHVGQIMLNKKRVTSDDLISYRENFSVIFHNFYVFKKILNSDNSAIKKHSEKLDIHEFVNLQKKELAVNNTSDGQRRRLALLNLFLEDRPCCIFDEPTSDQDPEFKDMFYREILPKLKSMGKTILVISHDKQYFDMADRIVCLKNGQITDDYYVE